MSWRLCVVGGTGYVEDDDGGAGIFNVGGDEGVEALLSRSVPQLHTQTLVLDVDGLGDEVHPHCRLHIHRPTCSLPVKLSKINRFMIDVLPTDWSPSSTILHFTAGLFSIFKFLYFMSTGATPPDTRWVTAKNSAITRPCARRRCWGRSPPL